MKQILVYENWRSETPTLIGRLFIEGTRGKEVCSFEYDSKWLKQSSGFILDPDLSLFNGRQFAPVGKELFGIFEDSCPDRWGRTLMDRREMILARSESRKPRSLTESDYLLGVHDMSRMGALRFKTEESGPFLSDNSDLAAPPWVALRELNDAVADFEKDPNKADKWMQMLIAPGSSLGGARPKANVVAPDGSLWIAKFPSKKDKINCSAWEETAYELAKMCGLSVVDCCLEKFSKFGSTFLVKRFDRELDRRNILFEPKAIKKRHPDLALPRIAHDCDAPLARKSASRRETKDFAICCKSITLGKRQRGPDTGKATGTCSHDNALDPFEIQGFHPLPVPALAGRPFNVKRFHNTSRNHTGNHSGCSFRLSDAQANKPC